jgi:hypothetical protein
MHPVTSPFDSIGKKFGADEDYPEAERKNYRVDCQNCALKGAKSSVENRDGRP